MCLRLFCGYWSLYIGCILIGLVGMLLSVMVFSVSLFELVMGSKQIFLIILAMVFAFINALANIFLIFGTMWDMCWAMLVSFIIGVFALMLFGGVVIMSYLHFLNALYLLFGVILCIIHLYNEWIIISTWWCCRSCTDDC
ncbi:uncharacterized protein LOC108112708 isoform X1 [Drosophila eugracilis]|uniref:uncharacterized protein LOC108112708 isoform X1 n=1 Tax=Drosophila eugracilis TaxID=29029 RepID=UPI0007E853A8|nr:uncharacterized protein LOC108112708 isoform X1 [Drosophila eugracilis]